MSRRRKILVWMLGVVAVLAVLLPLGGVLLLRSEWFREKVRVRIVEEVERATGGDVEIGSFLFDWRELRAQVNGFVLRGSEPASEAPLFRAESIVVGLKIISLIDRDVNIALLRVNRPEISVRMDEDGNTNVPSPADAVAEPRNPIEPLLDLAIERFEVADGLLRYDARTYPFSFSGQNLEAHSRFEASGPRYRGEISARQLELTAPAPVPVTLDADIAWALERERITIERARLAMAESHVELSGEVSDIDSMAGEFRLAAALSLAELARPLELPILPQGHVTADGKLTFGAGGFGLGARVDATGLAWEQDRVSVSDVTIGGDLRVDSERLRITGLRATALEGSLEGEAEVVLGQSFRVEGLLDGFAIDAVTPSLKLENIVWNGVVSGPIRVSGKIGEKLHDVVVSSKLTVIPAPGEHPLEGELAVEFRQSADALTFGPSNLATRSSRLEFSGSIDSGIDGSLETENLDDFLPAMAMATDDPPDSLPVKLASGVARLTGTVSGTWNAPRIRGRLATGAVEYAGHTVDRLTADFEANDSRLRANNISAFQGLARLRGDADIVLEQWRFTENSGITGQLSLTGADLRQLLTKAGQDLELDGTLSAAAKLEGTAVNPSVLASLHVDSPVAYGEHFDRLDAEVRYSTGLLEVNAGRLDRGRALLTFSAAYKHPRESWNSGELAFESGGQSFDLAAWKHVREIQEGLDAMLTWKLEGTAEIRDSKPRLTSLGGTVALDGLALKGRLLGDMQLQAATQRNVVTVSGAAVLAESRILLGAEWSLLGDSFGLGQVNFTGLTLDAMKDVGLFGGPENDIYIAGDMDGEIGFAGPILEPQRWQGMAKVTRIEIKPTAGDARTSKHDITMRNSGPLIFSIDPDGIAIQSARMVSANTDLTANGTLSFRRKNPWNLALKGSLELGVLSAMEEDLLARGTSNIDTVVRGSLLEPQVNGRLEFENASFHLQGLPNGLDQVNGAIIFNRTRATFESFTSRTGGGDLNLDGFILFGGEELIYRLQARAADVRVRYPEDVSTVFDAALEFTGSSTRSLLSGEISVTRAAFNPSTDIGSMLAETASPVTPTEITNPFLRGMGFDVRVVTAGGAEFMTSLTRDIELEADIVLRGGPARPIVIGNVSVNQGEIVFFGNKYDIVQGDVRFFNPIKIEPILAMDLETRVRGYTVMINFSGPMDKLNFSYRSDPPLQSNEIIALLTVGRAPGQARSGVGSKQDSDQSFLQAGGNTLLGQALAAPVSDRLQRFFGVSRIKIDPQLTGVENTPETKLTIEQQLSREITLTYVTNLARTQQQVVRIEWNFSRDWSVYAVRDSNGVFGMDFVYRRRF